MKLMFRFFASIGFLNRTAETNFCTLYSLYAEIISVKGFFFFKRHKRVSTTTLRCLLKKYCNCPGPSIPAVLHAVNTESSRREFIALRQTLIHYNLSTPSD